MRKSFVLGLAAALCLAMGPPVVAQQGAEFEGRTGGETEEGRMGAEAEQGRMAGEGQTVTGRIVSVDTSGRSITVETDEGRRTFQLGGDARIMVEGRESDLNQLSENQQVTLTTDGRTATRIEVREGRAAAGEQRERGRAGEEGLRAGDLPATASPLPLIGLAGLALVGLGAGLRARRRYF